MSNDDERKNKPHPAVDDFAEVLQRVQDKAEQDGHFDRVAKQIADEREHAERARRAREFAALEERGVPRRYAERIVDGDPLPTKALATCRGYGDETRKTLLVLSGPAGCGKTFAAAWLIANGPRSSRFIHASQLQRISPYSQAEMTPLETAALLVIDDIGVEYSDEKRMMLSILDGLLETRGGNLRKTVLTTNLGLAAFVQRYDGRIVDRVRDGAFVEFNNESLRGLN
jgi:DNA replication protein DnaC